MDVVTLEAEARSTGKSATANVRREGKVPCVLYGHGIEPVHFQVPVLSLRPLIYTQETHRVSVRVGKKSWDCVLKSVDFHPTADLPIHADFQVLIAGEKVTLTVPIHFVGMPIGQEAGGVTELIMTEIEVNCLPRNIPSNIEIDITHMQVGDAIHVGDLKFEQLDFLAPTDQTIVSVHGRGAHLDEAAEGAAEGETGEEAGEGVSAVDEEAAE